MIAFKLFLAAAVSGLVTAWPEPTAAAYLDNRAVDCAKVTGALSVLKKVGAPATTFCSSYLKIPRTKTATATLTPSAVTKATSTTTVTVTSAACGPANPASPAKRNMPIVNRGLGHVEDIKRADVLGLLVAFGSAKISEGCGCLNLQPAATKTTTFTAAAPTVNVVATSTMCVVPPPPACIPDGGSIDVFNDAVGCCSGASSFSWATGLGTCTPSW